MTQTKSSERRKALVTGAAQGIGAAIAIALAKDGFDVAITSRRTDALADTAAKIKTAGARALPVALDVLDAAAIERAMKEVLATFGHLDLLVNNAATTLGKLALDVTPQEWDAVIGTNLTGNFLLSQQMGRHLIATKNPGCIINVASTHGVVGFATRSTYGISKAAVIHMTRMLAIEWAEHGIRVNAIAPGTVLTPSRAALAESQPGYLDTMLNRIPLRRLGTPEEVALAVCYLASPQASYITGQTLLMDGGLTAY
jgi:NAD(P)-dependent dehydrogenase (short-subunit alcohol dehydrogenase family)